jgi:DNA-binding NarL/FixJ family response regulator
VDQICSTQCIIHDMRVLIADRNARLLESISLTFARQFDIHTASTLEHCADLLRQGEFDLAIVSEKLADGPGLQLLGQIARSSPDTLRIFAARQSRLQLLKGRLGPLGLFRTLPYPIDAKKLLSALTLARAGLEIDLPADPALGINMPVTITSVTRIRSSAPQHRATAPRARSVAPELRSVAPESRSVAPESRSVAPESPGVARQPQNPASRLRNIAPELVQPQRPQPQLPVEKSAPPQPAVVRAAIPPRLPAQSEAFQRALARREAAKRAASSQVVSRSSRRGATHPTHERQLADTAPKRTMVQVGVTMAVVFLVTTLTLNLFFGAAAPSSSAEATRSSIPRLEVEQPGISAPPENSTPAGPAPLVRSARSVARRAEPTPDSTKADVVALNPQMAASSTPIADPSSFGSEAYQAIYSN